MATRDPDAREVRKKGRKWIITLPPEAREHLGITHPITMFWHYPRRGEAVLALEPQRRPGAPGGGNVLRELAEARAQLERIRRRDDSRDRSMYAEGFAHGYMQAYERLVTPHGPSAERGHRRASYRWAHPKAAEISEPKQVAPRRAPDRPRRNSRARRSQREAQQPVRQVEAVDAPVLSGPAAPADDERARVEATLDSIEEREAKVGALAGRVDGAIALAQRALGRSGESPA